jgi:hypothetical protein
MRKQGKKINQGFCVLPLGMKRTKYEMDARAALLAIERGVCTEQHIVDLWVLADLCERLNEGREKYISTHAESVKSLAEAIHNKTCNGLASVSIVASSNILLDWIHKQDNRKIIDIALSQIKQLSVT